MQILSSLMSGNSKSILSSKCPWHSPNEDRSMFPETMGGIHSGHNGLPNMSCMPYGAGISTNICN